MISRAVEKRVLDRIGALPIRWCRQDPTSHIQGSLGRIARPRSFPKEGIVDERVRITDRLGQQPLWEGYGEDGATRSPSKVRTHRVMGRFYSSLVRAHQPDVIVEFGAAFGVSGMYWLAGLEANDRGRLFTYEVNAAWAAVADDNLAAVGSRYQLVVGTFEENVDATITEPIDVAFIDAIHTSAFVETQFDIVAERARSGAIVVLDDIAFSEDMQQCWQRVCKDRRVVAATTVTPRVGLVELA